MAIVPIESGSSKKLSNALARVGSFTPNYIRSTLTPKQTHLDKVADTFETALKDAGKKPKADISVYTKLANNHGGLPFMGALALEVGTEGILLSMSGMGRNFGYYKKNNPAPGFY